MSCDEWTTVAGSVTNAQKRMVKMYKYSQCS